MIITIDGPTASGKSTIARLLAEQLGFLYINSGLLFRAIAYGAHQKNIPIDSDILHKTQWFNKSLWYTYAITTGPQIWYNEKCITHLLTTPQIDNLASQVAVEPAIRQQLLTYQRTLAHGHNVVADGRDCGTVVFPNADHKFYITATQEVRAHRWSINQQQKGYTFTREESEEILKIRDTRDTQRVTAPLKVPDDAYIVDTTHMTVQEAVETCLALVQDKAEELGEEIDKT